MDETGHEVKNHLIPYRFYCLLLFIWDFFVQITVHLSDYWKKTWFLYTHTKHKWFLSYKVQVYVLPLFFDVSLCKISLNKKSTWWTILMMEKLCLLVVTFTMKELQVFLLVSTNTIVIKALNALTHTGLHVFPRYKEMDPLKVIMVFIVFFWYHICIRYVFNHYYLPIVIYYN